MINIDIKDEDDYDDENKVRRSNKISASATKSKSNHINLIQNLTKLLVDITATFKLAQSLIKDSSFKLNLLINSTHNNKKEIELSSYDVNLKDKLIN